VPSFSERLSSEPSSNGASAEAAEDVEEAGEEPSGED